MAAHATTIHAVAIPGEPNSLPATDLAASATSVGMQAKVAEDVETALAEIVTNDPSARVLICGSLYLAGQILAENG